MARFRLLGALLFFFAVSAWWDAWLDFWGVVSDDHDAELKKQNDRDERARSFDHLDADRIVGGGGNSWAAGTGGEGE